MGEALFQPGWPRRRRKVVVNSVNSVNMVNNC